jgi:hypothetical protein
LFGLGALIALPLFIDLGFFAYKYLQAYLLHRDFMSHEINRQIAARNPNWSQTHSVVEITDLVPADNERDEAFLFLQKAGYKCYLSENFCVRQARFDLVCELEVIVNLAFAEASVLSSAKAKYGVVWL